MKDIINTIARAYPIIIMILGIFIFYRYGECRFSLFMDMVNTNVCLMD